MTGSTTQYEPSLYDGSYTCSDCGTSSAIKFLTEDGDMCRKCILDGKEDDLVSIAESLESAAETDVQLDAMLNELEIMTSSEGRR